MNPVRILIAENDAQTMQQLRTHLDRQPDIRIVGTAQSGQKALALAAELHPDLLLTEVALQGTDGLEVIATLVEQRVGIQTIVLSSITREEVISRAIQSGAAYYMTKPCDLPLLVSRIRALCRPGQPVPAARTASAEDLLTRYVSHLLMRLTVSPHLSGHRFLREAVILTAKDPLRYSHISTELYPSVARTFGTTASRVERAIRFAVTRSWEGGGCAAFNRLLDRPAPLTERPSNREYIALLAEHVRLKLPAETQS